MIQAGSLLRVVMYLNLIIGATLSSEAADILSELLK